MSEIEYMNYISENHSDENVIILISSFITKTWNKLTTQIRAERGKSNKKAPQPDSAEVEGSKILEGRKEKTKTDKVYLETQKEELESLRKELELKSKKLDKKD